MKKILGLLLFAFILGTVVAGSIGCGGEPTKPATTKATTEKKTP
jgi:hypothetical protein